MRLSLNGSNWNVAGCRETVPPIKGPHEFQFPMVTAFHQACLTRIRPAFAFSFSSKSWNDRKKTRHAGWDLWAVEGLLSLLMFSSTKHVPPHLGQSRNWCVWIGKSQTTLHHAVCFENFDLPISVYCSKRIACTFQGLSTSLRSNQQQPGWTVHNGLTMAHLVVAQLVLHNYQVFLHRLRAKVSYQQDAFLPIAFIMFQGSSSTCFWGYPKKWWSRRSLRFLKMTFSEGFANPLLYHHMSLYTLSVIRQWLHDELDEIKSLSMQNSFCAFATIGSEEKWHRNSMPATSFHLGPLSAWMGVMTTPLKDMRLSIKQLYSKGSSQIHCKFNAYSNSKKKGIAKACKRHAKGKLSDMQPQIFGSYSTPGDNDVKNNFGPPASSSGGSNGFFSHIQ